MTQGVFVQGVRPKTKKALREAIASDPHTVDLEATSVFGNEYDGALDSFVGTAYLVGPDPYRARNWYAQIVRHPSGQITLDGKTIGHSHLSIAPVQP